MNPLHQLQQLGQSIWYDNIRRALLTSGRLAQYMDRYAVTGVTSNPTIFERAIAGSDDYDDGIREAIRRGVDAPEDVFWDLAIADIRDAADVLRPVYDRTDHADGFVSLELPPRLSHDTDGSVALAEDLVARVDRPNVMIKVPGTPEGVSAIEELIRRGVNVNVTLLFSPAQWRAVAEAHLRGLERRREVGEDLDVASVASLFVSRIDAKANDRLPDDLRNRLAVATAKVVYADHRDLLAGDRWQSLAAAGARPQRVLWASMSTKDPDLPETYYVSSLAADGTVATLPDRTMVAAANGPSIDGALDADQAAARQILERAASEGVGAEDLGAELQAEGDDKFAASFDRLLVCIRDEIARMRTASEPLLRRVEPIRAPVGDALDELAEADAASRLWQRDHTLWQDDPDEVANRLGWLAVAEDMEDHVDDLRTFADEVRADGLTHALVLGMGGSSLFPLVVARSFRAGSDGLALHVLDSDDPDAIERVERALPMEHTLVIASSKSGTTAETRSLLAWFWDRYGDPDRFAVITDPGTPLADWARERSFRRVFAARPDIGGRYSALSHFGLVPAALAGVDVAELLHRAGRMAAACHDCVRDDANPGVQLAAILGGAARAGRDKLTLIVDDAVAAFGLWVEQLIAESTGKHGTGILPVVGEPLGDPEVYGDDRLFVGIGVDPDRLAPLVAAGHPALALPLDDPLDLGREALRWEVATALAGRLLGINPFDQPDVEAAKRAARSALEGGAGDVEPRRVTALLEQVRPGGYIAIQAYVDPAASVVRDLEAVRRRLRDRYGVATTLGVGPRYLHSTGQLHKGGPDTGVFLQVVADHDDDPPIPGEKYGFATLERAQAAGDLAALHEAGRRAGRVRLDDLLAAGG